jgi:competence protein ComEC
LILAWLAAAFIAGVGLGGEIVGAVTTLWVMLLLPAMALPFAWRRWRLRLVLLLLLAFSAGAARFEMTRTVLGPHSLGYYNGRSLVMTGVVTSEPDVRDRVSYYVISVDQVAGKSVAPNVSGELELRTASTQIFNSGDRVQLSGLLKSPTNMPTAPIKSILARRGIYSEMSFPRAFVTGRASLGVLGVAMQIRAEIERSVNGALPDPEATLLIAILIGVKTAQLGTLAPVLIQTGLIHLIAISGIKIAIVAGTVHSLLRRTTRRTPTLILSVGTVFGYWLVSGATVAGLRASIMWLLVFVAAYLGRPTMAVVSLGVAATIMVALNPPVLWDTGFQLTTTATLSIVAFAPVFERGFRFMPRALSASLSTTSAAQVGILPIQISSYGLVSPISICANGVVLPLIPLTMIAGFLTAALPASPFAAISYSLVHLIIEVADLFSQLPIAWLAIGALPISITVAYYGLIVGLGVAASRMPSRPRGVVRGELLVGLIVAAGAMSVTAAAPGQPNQVLFVANGATLISIEGHHILIDGGSSPRALLAGLGESLTFSDRHIDVVVDTDVRSSNVASLLSVLQHYHVSAVFDPGVEYPSYTYARWAAAVPDRGIPFLALRQGVTLSMGQATLEVLSPDRIYSNPKDGAGVLLISYRHDRILYVGPLSPQGQADLPYRVDVRAPVVISSTALIPQLEAATGARQVFGTRAGTRILLP